MVTLYDLVSSLLGDLEDEPDAAQREDGSWLLDGIMPFDEVQELIGSGDLVGEDVGDYNTLGGFVMSTIGRVPEPADKFDIAGLRFEVLDMDGNRVDKVLVHRLPAPVPGSTENNEGKK
jgi:putative hemolysin